jgi:hypothetical protein
VSNRPLGPFTLTAAYSIHLITMAEKKRNTMDFYKKNPEAYKKKKEYEADRRKTDRERERYNERRRARRKLGLEGKMGNRDMSHTKDGKLVLENRSKNRSRNGEGGKGTLK